MPLAAIRIRHSQGIQNLHIQKVHGFNYINFAKFLSTQTSNQQAMSKEELKHLLSITQSDRERECVRYAVFKASGVTPSVARRIYGFDNMRERAKEVEACIAEAQKIREAVDELATARAQALWDCYGSDDSSDEDSSHVESSVIPGSKFHAMFPDHQSLLPVLQVSQGNWFEFVEQLEEVLGDDDFYDSLEKFFTSIPELQLSHFEEEKLVHSHDAFLAAQRDSYGDWRIARIAKGKIVSESDSDNPNDYVGLTEFRGKAGKALIEKKRKAIERHARRQCAKNLAEQRFLCRKVSKKFPIF